jgi:hypothetical protein
MLIKPMGYLILSIPIFVFALGFLSVKRMNNDTHHIMRYFKGEIHQFVILFVGILIGGRSYGVSPVVDHLILIAAALILLTLIDIWVYEKHLLMSSIVKSILQTVAVTLLVYVLYVKSVSDVPVCI